MNDQDIQGILRHRNVGHVRFSPGYRKTDGVFARWPMAPFEQGKRECSGGRTEECVLYCALDDVEFSNGVSR